MAKSEDVVKGLTKKDITKPYRLGDVGSKGQHVHGKLYHKGDVVNLTPAEALEYQSHGVPVVDTSEEEQDRPVDPEVL